MVAEGEWEQHRVPLPPAPLERSPKGGQEWAVPVVGKVP